MQLLARDPATGRHVMPAYVANLQVEARDTLLGGDIRVHSAERELSYTKRLDLGGARPRRRWGRQTPTLTSSAHSRR